MQRKPPFPTGATRSSPRVMTAPDFHDLTVIFDLDGTLIDSAPDLTEALNHVLRSEELSPVEPATVRSLVGQGARALIERGLELQGHGLPDEHEADRLVGRFIDYYREHIADHSVLFPGAETCMDRLSSWGATLAVCTNKPEALTLPLLDTLGISARFAEIIARDSLPEHKPSGVPLTEILHRTKTPHGVMIGDTVTDLGAARNAGLPCFLATFGYGHVEGPQHKKEQRFDDFEALPQMISVLMSAS